MRKILTIVMVAILNTHAVSLFGFQIGSKPDGTVDTTIYIAPLKFDSKAELHYMNNRLMSISIETARSNFQEDFEALRNYL